MTPDNEAGGPAVPRYFFQTSDREFLPDREGVELAGPEQARDEAVRALGEMLKDLDGGFWGGAAWRMEVTDEGGRTVAVGARTGPRTALLIR